MQDIYEILKEQGVEIDDKSKFEKTFFENYKTAAEVSKKNNEIAELKNSMQQRDIDFENVKKKLADTDGDKEKIGNLSKELDELKAKYTQAEEDFKNSMKKQQYEFAVKDAVSGIKFSSNSAKELFEQKLINQNLSIENGKILGLNDFIDNYKKNDADAFAEKGKPEPHFSAGSGNVHRKEDVAPQRKEPLIM